MNEFCNILSEIELEELEVFRDGTNGMSVEGKEIICFELLHKLINDKIKISSMNKDELLILYSQLKGFKEISDSLGLFDTSILETIVQKSKKLIVKEIERRK